MIETCSKDAELRLLSPQQLSFLTVYFIVCMFPGIITPSYNGYSSLIKKIKFHYPDVAITFNCSLKICFKTFFLNLQKEHFLIDTVFA